MEMYILTWEQSNSCYRYYQTTGLASLGASRPIATAISPGNTDLQPVISLNKRYVQKRKILPFRLLSLDIEEKERKGLAIWVKYGIVSKSYV